MLTITIASDRTPITTGENANVVMQEHQRVDFRFESKNENKAVEQLLRIVRHFIEENAVG